MTLVAGFLFAVTAAGLLCLVSDWPHSVMLDVLVSVLVSMVVSSEVATAWSALAAPRPWPRLATLIAHRTGLAVAAAGPSPSADAPAAGGEAGRRQVSRLRLALFVYLLGAEMVRPFLVLFIDGLYTPSFPLGHDVAIGLPYLSWGLAVIAATTLGNALNQRFSPRTVFAGGCLLAMVASLLMAVAADLYQVIVFRALIGVATGIVTLTGLLCVTKYAPRTEQARSMAAFVGAGVAGSIGGNALGGLLAGAAGFRPVFLVVAAVIAVAALLGLQLLPAAREEKGGMPPPSGRTTLAILLNWRVAALSLLLIVPGRMVIYGVFSFVLPQLLNRMGIGLSLTGHIMMSYFLVMAALSPLVSRHSDRFRCHPAMLGLGAGLSGLSAVTMAVGGSGWVEFAAVVLLGIGQAAVGTSQYAVAGLLFRDLSARYGLGSLTSTFRLVEMTAAVVAVPLISLGSGFLGCDRAVFWLGAATLAAALLGALLLIPPPDGKASGADEAFEGVPVEFGNGLTQSSGNVAELRRQAVDEKG